HSASAGSIPSSTFPIVVAGWRGLRFSDRVREGGVGFQSDGFREVVAAVGMADGDGIGGAVQRVDRADSGGDPVDAGRAEIRIVEWSADKYRAGREGG